MSIVVHKANKSYRFKCYSEFLLENLKKNNNNNKNFNVL